MTDSPAAETITNAAVIWLGQTVALPKPARHGDVIKLIADQIPESEWPIVGKQGFMTSAGHFVDRRKAAQIAIAAGHVQPDAMMHAEMLFSEDL